MFDKLCLSVRSYKFPDLRVLLKFLYIIGGIYITIYAVGLARYEFVRFSMDSKINNLIMLADGGNLNLVLARIPKIQKIKIPHEPVIYNIFSSIKALLPQFDEVDLKACEELYYLFSMHRKEIKGLHLSDLIIPAPNIGVENELNFFESHVTDSYFQSMEMNNHFFVKSYFFKVKFISGKFNNSNFLLSIFNGVLFDSTELKAANFSGARFHNCSLSGVNMNEAYLISADLSGIKSLSTTKFKGAIYNSMNLDISRSSHYYLSFNLFFNEGSLQFPPTKFSKGFDPKEEGMIDISDLSDDEIINICQKFSFENNLYLVHGRYSCGERPSGYKKLKDNTWAPVF